MLSSFMEELPTIQDLKATAMAISGDKLSSHRKFSVSLDCFPFPIGYDKDSEVSNMYNTLSESDENRVRRVYVVNSKMLVTHVTPWYQPGNVGQFFEVFKALGL